MNNISRLQQRILPVFLNVFFVFVLFYLSGCAGTPEVAAPTDQPQNRQRGEAKITYLGWSGWAVQTKNHFLIFDCITGERYFKLKQIGDSKVIVFISHGHKDHYASSVYNWKKQIKNIHYVSGNSDTGAADTLFMGGRQEIQIDDVKITSIRSTDGGVGFLVAVDDLYIFHAGDHAFWGGSFANYKWEIDYLAKKMSDIDFMFMPIATGNGEMRNSIYDGVVYAIEKLRFNAMFPMHGSEHLLQTFKEKYEKDGKVRGEKSIYSPKKNGEVFSYRDGRIF